METADRIRSLREAVAWEILSNPDLLRRAREVFQEKVERYRSAGEVGERLGQAVWVLRKIEHAIQADTITAKSLLTVHADKRKLARQVAGLGGIGVSDMMDIYRHAGIDPPNLLHELLALRADLVAKHSAFAVHVLRKALKGAEIDEDLHAAAMEGLLVAADLYSPRSARSEDFPPRFSSYAAHWIRKMVYRELRAKSGIPEHYSLVIAALRNASWDPDDPDREDLLMELTGLPRGTVRRALEIYDMRRNTVSLDSGDPDDGQRPLQERAASPGPDPEDLTIRKQIVEQVRLALAELPERDRHIVMRRMGGATLREIGEEIGIGPAGVHAAERKIKARLRQRLARSLGREF